MNFCDIIGQSLLIERLRSILDNGRVVHSYIFMGPTGIGKKTISGIFAKALVCTTDKDKPCDLCQSCRQFNSGNHPDVMRLISPKKTIGIDLIREMQADIKVKPFQDGPKIYIIEKADTMTPQAQNALLKTLEEPPQYVVIILLAENPAQLLPTVLSRGQHIRILPLTPDNVGRIIEKNLKISRDKALVFGKLSEGLPEKGLQLAQSQDYQKFRESTLELLHKLSQCTLLEAMEYTTFFQEHKDNIYGVLDLMQLWLRDVLVYRESRNNHLLINLDKLTEIGSLANVFTTETIQCMIESMEHSKKMLRFNANFQMTIENMLMKMQGSGGYAYSSGGTV